MKERDYSIIGFQLETQNGREWVVEYPDLRGVTGSGDSYEEALREAEENKRFFLQYLRENNLPLPTPSPFQDSGDVSGRVTLRMSKTTHRRVIERSKQENVSINTILNEAAVAYLERQDSKDFLCETLQSMGEYYNSQPRTKVKPTIRAVWEYSSEKYVAD